jgi:hypothetical protein
LLLLSSSAVDVMNRMGAAMADARAGRFLQDNFKFGVQLTSQATKFRGVELNRRQRK